MKKFDWDEAAKRHRPEIVAFLRRYHHEPLTEQAYVDGIKALGLQRTAPNSLRQNYHNLRNNFGFFPR